MPQNRSRPSTRSITWMQALLESNMREKLRLRDELAKMRGALALLMRVRNGGSWSAQDRSELRSLLQAAANVSPYLAVLAMPGSVLLLPLLAWHLDVRRNRRVEAQQARP